MKGLSAINRKRYWFYIWVYQSLSTKARGDLIQSKNEIWFRIAKRKNCKHGIINSSLFVFMGFGVCVAARAAWPTSKFIAMCTQLFLGCGVALSLVIFLCVGIAQFVAAKKIARKIDFANLTRSPRIEAKVIMAAVLHDPLNVVIAALVLYCVGITSYIVQRPLWVLSILCIGWLFVSINTAMTIGGTMSLGAKIAKGRCPMCGYPAINNLPRCVECGMICFFRS